jgi:ribonuclease BN (tRNA processing enzyme)
MRLVVLGSGTAIPHPKRSSPANWLETSGGSIVLDLGPSGPLRMAQEGLAWHDLDAVWVSHFHLDHVGGLPPLLFGIRNAPETRDRSKPLRIFGPAGTADLLHKFDSVNDYKLFKQRFPVEITEIEPLASVEILPGVNATAMKTPHTDESLAIRIDDGKASVTYSSDTGPTESLAAFAARSDLFLLECSFFRNKPVKKHLEFAEAVHLARRARAKQTILTHFFGDWDNADLAAEVDAMSPQVEIAQAFDGMVWKSSS